MGGIAESQRVHAFCVCVRAFSILIDNQNDCTVCTWGNVFFKHRFPRPHPRPTKFILPGGSIRESLFKEM